LHLRRRITVYCHTECCTNVPWATPTGLLSVAMFAHLAWQVISLRHNHIEER